MGEHAEDIIEGRCCQFCGAFLEEYLNDDEPDGFGFPVSCPDCDDEMEGFE